MDEYNWPRLARYVRGRRTELGLTQDDVASRGGPSAATIRLIETAAKSSYRGETLRQLEAVLRWTQGSAMEIVLGREPTPVARRRRPGRTTPATAAPTVPPANRPHYADPQLDATAQHLATLGEEEVRFSYEEIRALVALVAARLRRSAEELTARSA